MSDTASNSTSPPPGGSRGSPGSKLMRAQNTSRGFRTEPVAKRLQRTLRDTCEQIFTELLLSIVSTLYLAVVLADLIFDELYCDERSPEAIRLREAKTDVVTKVDLIFMTFFFCEVSLKVLAYGCNSFLSKWLNIFDLLIVPPTLAFDIYLVTLESELIESESNPVAAELVLLYRCVRIVRLFRIVAVLRRLLTSTSLGQFRRLASHEHPRCSWTEATKQAKGGKSGGAHAPKRFAAFLSHQKREAGGDARFIHDQLQLMLGADVFLDSSKLFDLRSLFDEGLAHSEVRRTWPTRQPPRSTPPPS